MYVSTKFVNFNSVYHSTGATTDLNTDVDQRGDGAPVSGMPPKSWSTGTISIPISSDGLGYAGNYDLGGGAQVFGAPAQGDLIGIMGDGGECVQRDTLVFISADYALGAATLTLKSFAAVLANEYAKALVFGAAAGVAVVGATLF